MESELGLLVKPPSLRAAVEAVEKIRRLRPQVVFIDLPESINDAVLELVSSGDLERFVEELERRLPKPASAWIKEYEPIIRSIPALAGTLDVVCYLDSDSFKMSAERSIELAILTARAIVTGRIEVEEWLRILRGDLEAHEAVAEAQAERLADLSMGYERSLCISSMGVREVKERLMERGVRVWVRYLGQPHHFTPLEILRRIISRSGEVGREEAEALIREHLKFIREYVYKKPYPQAVDEWSRDKLYWLPRRNH